MTKKFWTAFDVVALLMTVIYPVAITVEDRWSLWRVLLSMAFLLQFVAYVWAGSPLRREIAAGDPNPWQFLRWMDINGPTGHEHGIHEELYLRRLYIFRCPKFGLMLHWIKREDWDRDALHSHPWPFQRLIVWGGYTEQLAYPVSETELGPIIEKSYRAGYLGKFPDGAYHRITSVKPHTVSFCINGKKDKSWGFFTPGQGHVGWKDYLNGAR